MIYTFIFNFFPLNKVQFILESRENTLVYNFQDLHKNCRQTKDQSIIKRLDIIISEIFKTKTRGGGRGATHFKSN